MWSYECSTINGKSCRKCCNLSFHGARFDITTGKKMKDPVLTPSQQMEPLPKTWQKYLEHAGQLMSHIKTYDQEVYETRVEADTIKVKRP